MIEENFLQLNQDKTELLINGPGAQREKLVATLQARNLKACHQVKNLGFILDSELSFEPHICNRTKVAFYHLRNIAGLPLFLSQVSTETLMHACIKYRMYHCDALLSGQPKKKTVKLSWVLTRT